MRRVAGLILMIGMGWMLAGAEQVSSAQQTAPAGPVRAAANYAPLEVSFSYDYARANAGPGQCGCFNMNGGSAEVAFHTWRGLSAVADVTGERAGGVSTAPDGGLSLVSFTVGPRFSHRFSGGRLSRYTPFVQGLVGRAHGFDSLFPGSNGALTGAANSLAVQVGGGLDITMNKYVAIRVIQADYLRTQLPNNAGNEQNILRLGAGIVLHVW